ncbi:MAG TPA: thiamine phosphate synthase [Gemmatimonadales bacterium]|nr:thiamine phosphate synthase [Gemmatimonadales bacterium]
MRVPLPRVHAVTDERVARRPDLERVVSELARAGAGVALHARGRSLSGLEHYALAIRLSRYPPIRVFVNDRLDVALATEAAGVQLAADSLPVDAARRLGPQWWIGRSVHSLDQACAAQAEGADYLLAGPVYGTATHPDATPLGVDGLREIVELGPPVIAIGGIRPERARDLARAGVYGVAAIRALWDAPEPAAAALAFLEALERERK